MCVHGFTPFQGPLGSLVKTWGEDGRVKPISYDDTRSVASLRSADGITESCA